MIKSIPAVLLLSCVTLAAQTTTTAPLAPTQPVAPAVQPPAAATPPQTPVNAPQSVPPASPQPQPSPLGVQSPTTPPPAVQPLGIATQPAPPAPDLSSAATAQTPNPLRLTITEALRMALSEGTQARLARSARERAEIGQREALAGLLPQADARFLQYNESINLATFGFSLPGMPPVVGPFNVTDGQITAAMQVFNLAAVRRYRAMREGVKASRFEVQRAENDVAAAVARLYVLVQRAEAQVASRQADATLFEQLRRVASDELAAGTGTRLDVAQANVQRARAREALLRAQNDRETARLALLNAIGADESVDVILADPLSVPATLPPSSAAIATAQQLRPEIQQLASLERQAQLGLDAYRARRLPTVALDYQGDISGNYLDELHSTRRIAGVITMPLFHADLEANVARARIELEDARTRRAAVQRDVEQDVRTSLMSVQNATERVGVAAENVTVAEEALTIARDRRSAGYGSSVEVDRAEDAYRQAHEDLIAARADAALAWYSLQHATGEIRSSIPEAR